MFLSTRQRSAVRQLPTIGIEVFKVSKGADSGLAAMQTQTNESCHSSTLSRG